MKSFYKDVAYDISHGDKRSDRYHMNKMLEGIKILKKIKSGSRKKGKKLAFIFNSSYPYEIGGMIN